MSLQRSIAAELQSRLTVTLVMDPPSVRALSLTPVSLHNRIPLLLTSQKNFGTISDPFKAKPLVFQTKPSLAQRDGESFTERATIVRVEMESNSGTSKTVRVQQG